MSFAIDGSPRVSVARAMIAPDGELDAQHSRGRNHERPVAGIARVQ
jgi:hypothetical protein